MIGLKEDRVGYDFWATKAGGNSLSRHVSGPVETKAHVVGTISATSTRGGTRVVRTNGPSHELLRSDGFQPTCDGLRLHSVLVTFLAML